MKKIYLLFPFILLGTFGFSQTNTTYQTVEETEPLEKQHLVAIKDCFLCAHGDVNRAFRFGFGNINAPLQSVTEYTLGLNYVSNYFLEYEQKIATSFSIKTQLAYSSLLRNKGKIEHIEIQGSLFNQYIGTHFYSTSLSIEPRWYFNKKQEIKNGKSGNNLSGVYTGLLLSQNWWEDGDYISYGEPTFWDPNNQDRLANNGQSQIMVLNLGWQKRFRNRGFFNFQLGTGISHNSQNISILTAKDGQIIDLPALSKWKWLLNYQVTWGAVLGKKRQLEKIPDHFLEYYEEAKDMWKIDLYNIFQGLNERGAIGRLHIAYEHKIQRSSFSLEGGLQYLYSQNFETKTYTDQFALQVEPRFYYRLKKDTNNGKNANNLSSMYFGLLTQWNIDETALSPIKRRLQNNLTWGFQERIFKHFFIDYKVGLSLNGLGNKNNDLFFQDFRLGFAF